MSLAAQFENDGYVFIKGLLSPREAADYRAKLQKLSGLTDADFDEKKARSKPWTKADGVTALPDWWPLIFHKRLVATVREILGPHTRYTQHSDLHVHHGGVGWHRDSANRRFGVGPDWNESKEPYRVARVAIYLQSFAESGFSLGVIPGSHRKHSLFTKIEMRLHQEIMRWMKRTDLLFPFLTTRTAWFRMEPGDCLIFNQRIFHTGSHVRGPKYAVYLSYGVDNEHSRRHRRYYLYDRPDDKYEEFAPELTELLRKEDLLLPVSPESKRSA